MDAHIRKVYVPMTETGFYILLCLREEAHGYSIVQRGKGHDRRGDSPQPGHAVRHPVKDGKGRAHPLYAGGGKTEALPNHALGPRGARAGNENESPGFTAIWRRRSSNEKKRQPSVCLPLPIGKRNRTTCAASTSVDGSWTGSRFSTATTLSAASRRTWCYQLDYNPEGLANKEEYVQLFADCGWEYLQDYAGYSYFRKAVVQMGGRDEEIFCDDQSRLALVRRVFWGRMVPALVILLLLVCPYVIQGLISPP